jgi:hypothetical protein
VVSSVLKVHIVFVFKYNQSRKNILVNEGDMILGNVRNCLPSDTASHARRLESSGALL